MGRGKGEFGVCYSSYSPSSSGVAKVLPPLGSSRRCRLRATITDTQSRTLVIARELALEFPTPEVGMGGVGEDPIRVGEKVAR